MKKIIALSLLVLTAGLNNPSTANAVGAVKAVAGGAWSGTKYVVDSAWSGTRITPGLNPAKHLRGVARHSVYGVIGMLIKTGKDLTHNEKMETLKDLWVIAKELGWTIYDIAMFAAITWGAAYGVAFLVGYGVPFVSALAYVQNYLTAYCGWIEAGYNAGYSWLAASKLGSLASSALGWASGSTAAAAEQLATAQEVAQENIVIRGLRAFTSLWPK